MLRRWQRWQILPHITQMRALGKLSHWMLSLPQLVKILRFLLILNRLLLITKYKPVVWNLVCVSHVWSHHLLHFRFILRCHAMLYLLLWPLSMGHMTNFYLLWRFLALWATIILWLIASILMHCRKITAVVIEFWADLRLDEVSAREELALIILKRVKSACKLVILTKATSHVHARIGLTY